MPSFPPLIGMNYEDRSSKCVDLLLPFTFEGSTQGSRQPVTGLEEVNHTVLEHMPSTHQKGCTFPQLFAFAHISTLPAIFPSKQIHGNSSILCVCSNVFSSSDEKWKGFPQGNLILSFLWLLCPSCIPLSLYTSQHR